MLSLSPSKVFAISIAMGLLCVPHPASSQETAYLVLQSDTDARAGFDLNSEAMVDFRVNSSGIDRFGVVTRENVGERFAAALDDVAIFSPVIRQPMRSAVHPPKLTIIEERTVRDAPPEGQPR